MNWLPTEVWILMKLVLCNHPPEGAEALASTLVAERLAACVNLLPVRSIYRWKGEICQEGETTLLIKTAAARVPDLRARLLALHPYDVPEVLVLDVDAAASFAPYVQWVSEETAG